VSCAVCASVPLGMHGSCLALRMVYFANLCALCDFAYCDENAEFWVRKKKIHVVSVSVGICVGEHRGMPLRFSTPCVRSKYFQSARHRRIQKFFELQFGCLTYV